MQRSLIHVTAALTGAFIGLFALAQAIDQRIAMPKVFESAGTISKLVVQTPNNSTGYLPWPELIAAINQQQALPRAFAVINRTVEISSDHQQSAADYPASHVTDGFFEVVHAPVIAGHGLQRGRPDGQGVVISHALARRLFPEASQAVGAMIRINGRKMTVDGVLAPGFAGLGLIADPEIWLPLDSYLATQAGSPADDVVATFDELPSFFINHGQQDDHTLPAVIDLLTERLRSTGDLPETHRLNAIPWRDAFASIRHLNDVSHYVRSAALAAAGFSLVSLILAIAAAITRDRTSEHTRFALGARSIDLALLRLRDWLITMILLALITTAIIFLGGYLLTGYFAALALDGLSPWATIETALDRSVSPLLITLVMTAVFFVGYNANTPDRSATRNRRAPLQRIGLTGIYVLVLGALFALHVNLNRIETLAKSLAGFQGFARSENVTIITGERDPERTSGVHFIDPRATTAIVNEIADQLRSIWPRMAFGVSEWLPASENRRFAPRQVFRTTRSDHTETLPVNIFGASGEAIRLLGISIVAGRSFTDADAPWDVVLISERAAKQAFGDPLAALGQSISIFKKHRDGSELRDHGSDPGGGAGSPTSIIVGVFRDISFDGAEPVATVIRPPGTIDALAPYLLISLARPVQERDREIIQSITDHALGKNYPDYRASTAHSINALVERSARTESYEVAISFVLLALTLAAALAVIAAWVWHTLLTRQHELAIRASVGATTGRLAWTATGPGLIACGLTLPAYVLGLAMIERLTPDLALSPRTTALLAAGLCAFFCLTLFALTRYFLSRPAGMNTLSRQQAI